MNVLFLIPAFNSKVRYHPGLASLSALLKERGHKTRLLTVNSLDFSLIRDYISRFSPDIVAASSNSHQYYYIKKILPFIRENFKNLKIILGGVHATLDGNVINEIPELNAICQGEGEGPLLRLVDSLEKKKADYEIPNITFRTDGGIKKNYISYYVEDLDSLPYPDYSIFPLLNKKESLKFPMRFLFNRGCPFNCSYCCNHKFKELFPERKSYVRYKSPARAVEELVYFSDIYDFGHYVIDDDILTLDKKWLLNFCNSYPEKLKQKTFEANVMVGTADRETLKALKSIGCSLIKVGVESGSERLRRSVLQRKISQEKIIETVDMVKSVGLDLFTFNMVGMPGETRRDVWETIRLNRVLGPMKTQLTVFYPYKNTVLGDYCYEKGLVKKNRSDSYFTETILKFNKALAITKPEVDHYISFFQFYVYVGRNNRKALKEFIKGIRRYLSMIKNYFKRLKRL